MPQAGAGSRIGPPAAPVVPVIDPCIGCFLIGEQRGIYDGLDIVHIVGCGHIGKCQVKTSVIDLYQSQHATSLIDTGCRAVRTGMRMAVTDVFPIAGHAASDIDAAGHLGDAAALSVITGRDLRVTGNHQITGDMDIASDVDQRCINNDLGRRFYLDDSTTLDMDMIADIVMQGDFALFQTHPILFMAMHDHHALRSIPIGKQAIHFAAGWRKIRQTIRFDMHHRWRCVIDKQRRLHRIARDT
nr:MAG TPA: hypothetical protein [Caudoviricetes sp.]